MEEVSKTCSDILGEIVETTLKDASETVDEVCDSILDILNLDSPGIYSDPKNPSALLVFGQNLPSLLRDNLLSRMCLIRQALGEPNSSTYTLASELTTFLLKQTTHHSLLILSDYPWASMGLEAETDFINLLVSTTRNICAHHHTHPSFRPCKFVCLNLYQDRADFGDLVARESCVGPGTV